MSSPRNKKTDPDVSGPEWFEDEHFWESTYPFIFAAEKFAGGEAEVTEFAKLTGSPFRRVLDLCCG
ncbi:MAG TPA: hypothetical protein VF020_17880, partial [Chthoniobacterales bacterium]